VVWETKFSRLRNHLEKNKKKGEVRKKTDTRGRVEHRHSDSCSSQIMFIREAVSKGKKSLDGEAVPVQDNAASTLFNNRPLGLVIASGRRRRQQEHSILRLG